MIHHYNLLRQLNLNFPGKVANCNYEKYFTWEDDSASPMEI